MKKEPVALTVGQLKDLLKSIPDHYFIGINHGFEGISGIHVTKEKRRCFCWLDNNTINFPEN